MDVDDGSFWGGCRDHGSWRLDLNADEDNGFEIAVDADDDDGVIVLNADEDSGCRGCPDRVRKLGCRRSPLMEVLRSRWSAVAVAGDGGCHIWFLVLFFLNPIFPI